VPTSTYLTEPPGHLGRTGATILGMVLAATPVALWIAWTPEMLGWIIVAAICSASLLVMLTEPEPSGAQCAQNGGALPEHVVDEIHLLFPLIYHHSGRNNVNFRRAMQRLSRTMAGSTRGKIPR